MAHNHRMSPIADPYLTRRNAYLMRKAMGMVSPDVAPSLEGISQVAGSDVDDTDLPISTTERAFGESGQGYSVRKEKEGQ